MKKDRNLRKRREEIEMSKLYFHCDVKVRIGIRCITIKAGFGVLTAPGPVLQPLCDVLHSWDNRENLSYC